MSEPMSSVEIEDVLSSIRRLVSEDLRPAARPAPEAAPSASQSAAQMAASKLILTPALRVVAEDVPAAVSEPVAAPVSEPWDDGEAAAFVNVEDDAVFEDDADWQPKAAVINLTSMQEPPRAKAEAQSVAEPAAEFTPAPQAIEIEAPVAEPLEWASQNTDLQDWDDALSEDDPVLVGDSALLDAAQPETELVLEDAVPEPLDAVWADAAEAEVLRQLADDGVTAQASSQAGPQAASLSEDDMIYEENLLRDLVRDIIREELQGELGERITRNVRKLVRAEIARAMALRDFD